jgi:hypothetical protein
MEVHMFTISEQLTTCLSLAMAIWDQQEEEAEPKPARYLYHVTGATRLGTVDESYDPAEWRVLLVVGKTINIYHDPWA